MIRLLLRTGHRDAEAQREVYARLVETPKATEEITSSALGTNSTDDFGDVSPTARLLMSLDAPASPPSATAGDLRDDGRRLALAVEAAGMHEWSEDELEGIRLVAKLVSREIMLRQEVVSLRQSSTDSQAQRLFDPITGLPGRELFVQRLERAVRHASRHPGSHFAVLFVGVDQLESIYHGFGREITEELIRSVADRVRTVVRTDELLARSPREGFFILLEDVGDELGASRVALRIHDALAQPIALADTEIRVSLSIGIMLSTIGLDSPDRIIGLAAAARARSQEVGPGGFQIFEPQLQERVRMRLEREAELRRAIEQGELEVLYQPVVSLHTGEIVELDAVVQWNHPRRGPLPASAFLPMAEETDMIVALTWWVLATACPQVRDWHERLPGRASLGLAVKFAARTLTLPHFLDTVGGIVAASGLDAKLLRLEVEQSALDADPANIRAKLAAVRESGHSVYLTEFGTGHSALQDIVMLPFDGLKLAPAFVERVAADDTKTSIVRTIRQLARDLGVTAIAEGIESQLQHSTLRDFGYDFGQGSYFAKPMTAEGIEALMRRLNDRTEVDGGAVGEDPAL
jgi:diguanylate cyclase (GGDEF)-like protein